MYLTIGDDHLRMMMVHGSASRYIHMLHLLYLLDLLHLLDLLDLLYLLDLLDLWRCMMLVD